MRAGRAIACGGADRWRRLALAGCGEGGLAGGLRSAGVAGTPDEFMVLPTRPLEMPENFAALPPPTPGAANRVDYRPHAEAIAGLTGRPRAPDAGGARAGRRGRARATRRSAAQLAAEDVTGGRPTAACCCERLIAERQAMIVDLRRPMVLDAPGRVRAAARDPGVQVPAAPPASCGARAQSSRRYRCAR